MSRHNMGSKRYNVVLTRHTDSAKESEVMSACGYWAGQQDFHRDVVHRLDLER